MRSLGYTHFLTLQPPSLRPTLCLRFPPCPFISPLQLTLLPTSKLKVGVSWCGWGGCGIIGDGITHMRTVKMSLWQQRPPEPLGQILKTCEKRKSSAPSIRRQPETNTITLPGMGPSWTSELRLENSMVWKLKDSIFSAMSLRPLCLVPVQVMVEWSLQKLMRLARLVCSDPQYCSRKMAAICSEFIPTIIKLNRRQTHIKSSNKQWPLFLYPPVLIIGWTTWQIWTSRPSTARTSPTSAATLPPPPPPTHPRTPRVSPSRGPSCSKWNASTAPSSSNASPTPSTPSSTPRMTSCSWASWRRTCRRLRSGCRWGRGSAASTCSTSGSSSAPVAAMRGAVGQK